MKPRKQSAFLKLSLTILAFYFVYNLCFFSYDSYSFLREFKQKKTKMLTDQIKISMTFLRAQDLDGLKLYLDDSVQAKNLDFYVLGKNGDYVQKNSHYVPPEILFSTKRNQISIAEGGTIEFMRMEEAGAILILGSVLGPKYFVRQMIYENKGKFIADIVFVFTSLFGIVLFYFRDIIRIYSALVRRDRGALQGMKGDSTESDLLLGALGGYEQTLQKNEARNSILEGQVLPALQHELNSGKKAPYTFFCVMVRTDINQFSTIFNTFPREPFLKLIQEFFLDCSAIIARYNGLIEEFAGDEVIYYFKEEDGLNPFLLAVGAVREINELATKYHERARNSAGHSFYIKSAMARGELRFGKLVNAFTVTGAPFIETVRILSEISEKDHNSFYFTSESAEVIRVLTETQFEKKVILKGYSKEISLCSYVRHKRISFLQEQLPLLSYRRSEQELGNVLQWLKNMGLELEKEDFLAVVKALSGFKSQGYFDSVTNAYIELLQKYTQLQGADEVRLASLLGLTKNFVAKNSFPMIEAILRSCLEKKDQRVIANAIDLFSYYDPNAEIKTSLGDFSGRVSASLLVKEAAKALNKDLVRKLKTMLDSGEVVQIASAIYAMGEIAIYYGKIDPVYLSTRRDFTQLLEDLVPFVNHENLMVVRQALVAIKKCGNENLLAQVPRYFEGRVDVSRLSLYREIFGTNNVIAQERQEKKAA